MQKLREKLDEQGVKDGKDYILSFAGAAGSWYINNIEPLKLMPYIDYVNVMTYDIHGISILILMHPSMITAIHPLKIKEVLIRELMRT